MSRDFKNEPEGEAFVDPMAPTDGSMFPYRIRDMKDVEAELQSALSMEQLTTAMSCSAQEADELNHKGLLFSVPHNDSDVYPEWQLNKDGQPIAEFAEILAILQTVSSDPINQLIYMLTGLDFFKGQSIKDFLLEGDYSTAIQEAHIIAKW